MIGIDVDVDSPLMDAGLDSLSAYEFRGLLKEKFAGVAIPATLVFDLPTIRQICEHIAPSSACDEDELGLTTQFHATSPALT
eukprot:1090860-Prymnesium_polylepis.1